MNGYTKLFNSILASTIWRSNDKTRLVWITMMAMSDKNGIVEASIPGLADLAHVSIPDCQAALIELLSPDEFSRSKERDGRRIEEIDGGWHLINHDKYRKKMGADERREYLKLKQREYRSRDRKQASTSVNNVSDTDTELTHTEAEAYTEATIPVTKNKLDRKPDAVTKANGEQSAPLPPKADSRSKRPIFTGQRLTVFEWMYDDCTRTLGPLTNDFDLHEWFYALDTLAANANMVIPKRDGGAWLQAQLLEEAKRRNLPIAVVDPPKKLGRVGILAQAVADIRREERQR